MSNSLPSPLVPADLDLRDQPIPVELFAQLAAVQLGVPLDEARAHAQAVAARMAQEERHRRGKRSDRNRGRRS